MLTPEFREAQAELQAIAPLPDDDILNTLPVKNHPVDRLYDVLTLLRKGPYSLDLLLLLLNVFGTGEGMEVFQHVVAVIENYPDLTEAYPLIQKATESANAGTRKWCCVLLGRRRKKEDIPYLVARLQDEIAPVRQAAVRGLLMMGQRWDLSALVPEVKLLLHDEDYAVQRTVEDALEVLEASSDCE